MKRLQIELLRKEIMSHSTVGEVLDLTVMQVKHNSSWSRSKRAQRMGTNLREKSN